MDQVDLELLTHLLDTHSAALVLYAQQWCDTPEDAVQVAFIRLMRERPAPSNPIGWLYRVARNEAITQARSRSRRTRHEATAASTRQSWFNRTDDDTLDATAAVATLQLLPRDEREVIVLRLWSGLSFEEIAELIGKSTSTAHRWYESGLTTLRENWCSTCQPPKTHP